MRDESLKVMVNGKVEGWREGVKELKIGQKINFNISIDFILSFL